MEINNIEISLPDAGDIVDKFGLEPGGKAHRFLMQTVVARIQKYMWRVSGAAIKKMIIATNFDSDKLIMPGPESRMLYHGKVMVNSVTGKGPGVIPDVGPRYRKGTTLKATDRDLNFNTEKNKLAGPEPDKRMMEAEVEIIVREVESYIRYIGGKND